MIANHSQASSATVPLLDQAVYVNGSLDQSLWCTSISIGCGAGTSTANFKAHQLQFDSSRATWRDALVSVYVKGPDGSTPANPDWLGYLDVGNATLDANTDTVAFTGNSITAYLGKVSVGQTAHTPVLTYALTNEFGRSTGLTPARVLRDLLAALPSRYAARVALGDAGCINTSSIKTPPIVFRNTSVIDAIEQIIALFGDVTFTERYAGSKAYLDLFRVQDTYRPYYTCRVAAYEDPATAAISVAGIQHTESVADAVTRVIVYGAPRRFIVSATNYDTDADKKLINGWSAAQEARVLADPRLADDETHTGSGSAAGVFRRYLLPKCFLALKKLKDLGLTRSVSTDQDVETYGVQVWKYGSVLTRDGSGNYTGAEDTTPTLLENVKLSLDQGYFQLGTATDGLRETAITTGSDGKRNYAWTQAKIGITFAVESDHYVYYDTGEDSSSGIAFDFAADGLTEQIQRDDLTWTQATNYGYAFSPATGTGSTLTFDCKFYNLNTETWADYTSATVQTDPTDTLRQTAKEVLKSKNRRHHTYNVRIPWFDRNARPGYQITITGLAEATPRPLMISQVTWDLEGNNTEIAADNVQPPKRNTLERGA